MTKHMSNELDVLRVRIKELEAAEVHLEKTELALKEDLTKLKTLTVMLVDERKGMAEKLKLMEDKVQNSTGKLQAEQDKVNTVTEKTDWREQESSAVKGRSGGEDVHCH